MKTAHTEFTHINLHSICTVFFRKSSTETITISAYLSLYRYTLWKLCRELVSIMRGRIINVGANRNDPIGIDRRMASVVMPLDVLHIDCARHAWDLIYVFGVIEQIGILM